MNNTNQNEQWVLLVFLLKEIAAEKKITHDVIAEKTGMHRSSVVRFFSAKYRPNLHIFLEVAKAVGVNVSFEEKDSTDLNVMFERAMEAMGRRVKAFPKN